MVVNVVKCLRLAVSALVFAALCDELFVKPEQPQDILDELLCSELDS
jgi:hypothetical protein